MKDYAFKENDKYSISVIIFDPSWVLICFILSIGYWVSYDKIKQYFLSVDINIFRFMI